MDNLNQSAQPTPELLQLPSVHHTANNMQFGWIMLGLGVFILVAMGAIGTLIIGSGLMILLIAYLRKDIPYVSVGPDFIRVSGFPGAHVLFNEVQGVERGKDMIKVNYLKHGDHPMDTRQLKLHLKAMAPQHQVELVERLKMVFPSTLD